MIDGAHVIVYSRDAEADRAFLRDILRSNSVDAGDGWLIFALPPAEIAVHPTDEQPRHELYLMCDDMDRTIAELSGRGARCRPRPMRAGACSRRSRCRAEPRCPCTSRDILSRTPGEHRLDRSRTYGIDPALRLRKHVL
jgi:hypothetical protein